MDVLGYEVIEKIYESPNSITYRAVKDNTPVIIKILNSEYPSDERIAQFKYEYEIIKDLNSTGVIKAYSLEKYNGSFAIVFEDFGGEPMGNFDFSHWKLKDKLELFIRLLDVVDEIHAKKIVHKDINPSNILINRTTGEIKFIDFGNATKLVDENPVANSKIVIEGTLAYISPEQTGRMNRIVDYRSDYYSLGATFYELLASQKIFPDINEPIELMHYHLAKEPKPLNILDTRIPLAVSQIIMKLLAKNAEDRYQSILGIKSDLLHCIQQLREKNVVEDFVIGSRDNLDRFQIPQKFYGRKREITRLIAAYDQVCTGGYEFMLLAGPSGIGKSALVNKLQKLVLNSRGYFISGKYDKYRKSIPYSGIIDAFRELVRLILIENDEKIAFIKQILKERLGRHGRIIIDVIPEVAFLIGEQPPVEELPPVENQNRFNFVFKEFVASFLGQGNPLVIFLDDLQWADNASLELLKIVSIAKDSGYLFIIGSYRDNEMDELHPLKIVVDELDRQGVTINHLKLNGIGLEDVNELVANTLRADMTSTRELAALIYNRTEGTPFDIGEILKQLYEKEIIYFDNTSLCWAWDIEKINKTVFAKGVSNILVERIKNLEENTRKVLKSAALFGNRFDYNTLSAIDEGNQQDMVCGLWKALEEGLIQPLHTSYRFQKDADLNSEFTFSHDRIQQAAYSLLEDKEKQYLHFKIGRILKANTKKEELEHNIFDIVTHLNLSRQLIKDEKDIKELVELNYIAGMKAKRSSAFGSALEHFVLAIELAGSKFWTYDKDLALKLYTNAAEAAYSSAEYDRMEYYIDVVCKNCDSVLDRIKIHEIKILSLLAKNNAKEAVTTALAALKDLGVEFPEKISKGYILYRLLLFKISFWGKSIDDLSELPKLTDKEKAAVMRLLATVSSSAYLTAPELFVLMVLEQVKISIMYGNSIQSPFAYCTFGVILCGLFGDVDAGYRFGKVGLAILEKMESKELVGKTLVVANIFVTHWKDKLDDVLSELMRAYILALEAGDVEYAAWALLCHDFHSFFAGKNIKKVSKEIMVSAQKIKFEFRQEKQYNSICAFRQLVQKLHKNVGNKTDLSDENYNENDMLELYEQNDDNNGSYYIYSNKMILNLFFENYHLALKSSELAEKYIESVVSTINYPVFFFYSTLVYLATYDDLDAPHRKKIGHNLKKLEKWAKFSPHSHKYKYYLIKAECCRIEKEYEKAADFYNLAIACAIDNGFIQDAALANEWASKFYRSRGKESIAKAYLYEAYDLYQKWGADEKIRQLEEKHRFIKKRYALKDSSISSDSYNRTDTQIFDISSIIKISQLLSSEINHENLIRKMMNIVMENAGAQKAYFLIKLAGELFVEAEVNIDDAHCRVFNALHIGHFENVFSRAIINYVLRTEESVVIHDAANDKLFLNDSYVKKFKPKSILCIPVLTKNKLVGLLYFENNLATEVFTQDRIEFLKVVASQSAISLENINLYRHLEEKVRERTAELNERTAELEKAYEDLKIAMEKLRYLSLHDALTGLYNRAYFEQEMKRFDNMRDSSVGIMICDVDCLKLVNDTLGHEAGDRLIEKAANVVRNTFRPSDMVARIGGDEFAALIPEVDSEVLEGIGKRMQAAVEKQNSSDTDHLLSISVGFAVNGQDGSRMDETFKEADAKMYRNKLSKASSVQEAIFKNLFETLRERDFFACGHVDNVKQLVLLVGRKVGLPEKNIENLCSLAQFHDIGKVGIPKEIIYKPESLTTREFIEIQKHCEIGYRIAKSIPDIKQIAELIIMHHEWWDGTGYPLGVKGMEVPVECRIFTIAEAYDVMTSNRPYRKAMSREKAVRELKKQSGKQFDPKLVEVFLTILQA